MFGVSASRISQELRDIKRIFLERDDREGRAAEEGNVAAEMRRRAELAQKAGL